MPGNHNRNIPTADCSVGGGDSATKTLAQLITLQMFRRALPQPVAWTVFMFSGRICPNEQFCSSVKVGLV